MFYLLKTTRGPIKIHD